jgi:hypothetical protein
MYGFTKTRHDSNHHEFTHKLFQRGRRDLLPLIRRKTQVNSNSLSSSNSNSTTVAVPLSSPMTSLGNKLSQQHLQSIDFGSLLVGHSNNASKKGVALRGTISPEDNVSGSQSASGFSSEGSGYPDQGDYEDERAVEVEERDSGWVQHEYSLHLRNEGFLQPFSGEKTVMSFLSSGKSSDGVEESSRDNTLERRVQQLEQQVTSLTEFTLNLLSKHDLLCEALQSVLQEQSNYRSGSQESRSRAEHQQLRSSQYYDEGMYDDMLLSRQSSQQSQRSSEQQSQSLSSVDPDSSGNDNDRAYQSGDQVPVHQPSVLQRLSLFQSEASHDDDGPPVNRLMSFDKSVPLASVSNNNSVDGSALMDENPLIYCSPSSFTSSSFEQSNSQHQQQMIQSTALVRIPSTSVNFLEYQSDRSLQLSSLRFSSSSSAMVRKKRAVSLDLGGLEAIAAAAQILDDSKREGNGATLSSTQRPPLHRHDRLRKSKILIPSSIPEEEKVDEADYASLLLQRNRFNGTTIGGGSLMKASSWGCSDKLI